MIRLTLSARDVAHAQKILAAVAKVDCEEILVTPNGDDAPMGHTYRELCDARRDGVLDARLTPKGLVFTIDALYTYEETKAERRRKKRQERDQQPAPVTDLTDHRVKALEHAGFKVPGRSR